MIDEDEQLIWANPGGWWIGCDQISGKIGWSLLRKCLISPDESGYTPTKGEIFHYNINEDGVNCLNDPSYVPRILREFPESYLKAVLGK